MSRAEDIRARKGCGNHSCYVTKPKGQGTNSGCSCVEDKPRHELRNLLMDRQWLLARVERLETVVGQAQGLFGDVIVQGECGCDGCKMKRALDKLEESDGE